MHCKAKDTYKTVHSLLKKTTGKFPSGDNLTIASDFAKHFVDKVIDIRNNIKNGMSPPVQDIVTESAANVHTLPVFPPTETRLFKS